MNAGQYEGLLAALHEIRDRLPAPAEPEAAPTEALADVRDELIRETHRASCSLTLFTLLTTLDGWIQISRENHDGFGHRDENQGEECWTRFHPADIRSMVNDVARQLGVTEFPKPEHPKEGQVR
jgi:hypothetical protein